MSFAKKLCLSFGAVILLTLALGASFFVSARQSRSSASSLIGDSLPGVYSLGKLQRLVPELKGTLLMHINSFSSAEMDALEGQISQADTAIRQEIKTYRDFVSAPEEQKMYERLLPTMDRLMAAWQNARVPSRANQIPRQ